MEDDKLLNARTKIVDILKTKGPSLPVQIASQTEISSLFAGALLSELAADKIIKISHMKVGGSPLYFIKGQEALLEKFHPSLPGKEKEAFLLLRKYKMLDDKEQEPAIRVALRNLHDFAFPLLKEGKVLWRFYSTSEQEVGINPKKAKTEVGKPATKIVKETVKKQKELDLGLKKPNPKPIIITKKEKGKSDFVLKIINSLQSNNMQILEEKDIKKKEFSAIINISSALGGIKFFCIAKDKKKITESDLRVIVQKTQTLKMPALVIFPSEINKKALDYAKTCPLLKLRKLS
jgi:hypothetical protein